MDVSLRARPDDDVVIARALPKTQSGPSRQKGRKNVPLVPLSIPPKKTPSAILRRHDWSLPRGAVELLARVNVPKWCADDLLQRCAGDDLPYCDTWPSLFVGAQGTRSATHVDAAATHFCETHTHTAHVPFSRHDPKSLAHVVRFDAQTLHERRQSDEDEDMMRVF